MDQVSVWIACLLTDVEAGRSSYYFSGDIMD